MSYFGVLVGLVAGNFLYALVCSDDYERAFEWSVCQAIAVACLALAQW